MKHVKLFEQFVNESVNVDELIKHLENELDWNHGTAQEMKSKFVSYTFPKGPKDTKNIFITYRGMKGQSIAKDIREAIKDFGAKALQVVKENGDNEHYYHIEIKR
jgi:hypothetical protein